MGSPATAPHAVSTAMGPESQRSTQPRRGDAFIPPSPLLGARGERVGMPGWKKPAMTRHSELTLPVFSSCRLPVAHPSFGRLPAGFAKSEGAHKPPFTTLGIRVMSQVLPPDASQCAVY